MSARHVATILRRDIRLGPRSPIVLWALVIPVLLTVLIQGLFGDLFAPQPRLVIADVGRSQISIEAPRLDGITVVGVERREEMLQIVGDNDADAGLYLPEDFDQQVRSGASPTLEFYVGGESLASNRIILAVTTLELIRQIEGTPPPVEVVVNQLGEATLDIGLRLLPMLLMLVVAVAAGFMTAASIVQEKEDRTLSALLVSPASITDVIAAKAAFGILLGMVTGFATLVFNDALLGRTGTHFLILLVAALMMSEFGLLLGIWARDSNTMFAAWKGGGILIFFPAIFYLFPDLPQWIAPLGPTYYFINPSFRVVAEGASLSEVSGELAIGALLIAALLPVVLLAARRLERTLGAH